LREKYTHELWLVTRLSLQNRFDHWINLVRPIDIEDLVKDCKKLEDFEMNEAKS